MYKEQLYTRGENSLILVAYLMREDLVERAGGLKAAWNLPGEKERQALETGWMAEPWH